MTQFAQQVLLCNQQGGQTVCWIESEAAVVGRQIKLKLGEGVLSELMQVVEVYQSKQPWNWIRERGADWRRTRSASDI